MTMFLSKVLFHPTRNPYETHRILWGLFPDMPDADRPFLYRMSWSKHGKPNEALMQSRVTPNVGISGSCKILATKEFKPKLSNGQILRFALCANPTKRLSSERKRVPLLNEKQQLDWLDRKIGSSVDLLETQVAEGRVLHFWRKGVAGKVFTIKFNGIMRISDPNQLVQTIEDGVGPAKSFGCGMLSIAPA